MVSGAYTMDSSYFSGNFTELSNEQIFDIFEKEETASRNILKFLKDLPDNKSRRRVMKRLFDLFDKN